MKNFYFIMVLITISAKIFAQTETMPTGSGTSSDPYLIASLNNLAWLQDTANDTAWGAYYKQTADIDASFTTGWNSGSGLSPIGNVTINFTGTYDGNGHTISGLFIKDSLAEDEGMFGVTVGSTIKNLGLTSLNITGSYYVGGLVGNNFRSTIIDSCYTTGSVTAYGDYSGGLVGYNSSGSVIEYCYSSVSTSGGNFIGGLAGYNLGSTIDYSYSSGSVTGTLLVGGLAGRNYASTIDNSYSSGSVSGTKNIGGLVGDQLTTAKIVDCYSMGSVSGDTLTGGLVSYNSLGGGTVTNSFWDTQTSGQSSSTGGTGETTINMKDAGTFIMQAGIQAYGISETELTTATRI